jgi:aspartate kinase
LQARYRDASISAHPVAIVSVIGSDISRPALVSDALAALAGAGIDIIAMQHQIRNVDVQFIVDVAKFEAAIGALHGALVEADEDKTKTQHAA